MSAQGARIELKVVLKRAEGEGISLSVIPIMTVLAMLLDGNPCRVIEPAGSGGAAESLTYEPISSAGALAEIIAQLMPRHPNGNAGVAAIARCPSYMSKVGFPWVSDSLDVEVSWQPPSEVWVGERVVTPTATGLLFSPISEGDTVTITLILYSTVLSVEGTAGFMASAKVVAATFDSVQA